MQVGANNPVLAPAVLIWAVWASLSVMPVRSAGSDADSLSDRITELRGESRYAEALEIARSLQTVLELDPDSEPWKIADAQRLVAMLRDVAGLPASAQRELAEADRLTSRIDEASDSRDYDEASELAARQLEIRRRYLSEDYEDVASSLNAIALSRREKADYETAERLFSQVLTIRERLLGPEHPGVATSLSNLAGLCRLQGRDTEAEPLLDRALAIREKLLGPEHPSVAASLNNLGTLYQEQGRYAEAEPLLKRALVSRENIFGPEDGRVASSLNNLAILYQEQGRFTEAEPLLKRALMVKEKSYGLEHPELISTLANLARLYAEQDNLHAAQPLFERAYAIARVALSPKHPRVAMTANALAHLYKNQQRYADAVPLYEEAIAIAEEILGPEHPRVATSLNGLSNLYRDQGRFAEAESLATRALSIWERAYGPRHRKVAGGLANLAVIRQEQARYVQAEDFLRQALAVNQSLLGREHPDVAWCLESLAKCLLAQDRPEAAEPLLAEAAGSFEAARLRAGSGFERATFAASPYTQLAAVRLDLGKVGEAWPPAERALGRALADLLIASDGRSLTPAETDLQDSLKQALAKTEGELAALQTGPRSDASAEDVRGIEEAHILMSELEAAWSILQRKIASKHPVSEGQSFPLERVQSALTARSALVGWLHAEKGPEEFTSWGYVIRNSGPVKWVRLDSSVRDGDLSTSGGRAQALRNALILASRWRERVMDAEELLLLAADVWKDWGAPLTPHLAGIEELVIIPSGPMLGMPVETLVDETGTYIADRYTISYAPSSTIYTWLREQSLETPEHSEHRALLVGDPPFTEDHLVQMDREAALGGELLASSEPFPETATLRSAVTGNAEALAKLPRLRWSRKEVEEAARVISHATTLLGPDASEQRLFEMHEAGLLREFHTIHLATHALVDDEAPERSAFVFSRVHLPDPQQAVIKGERIFDGLLSAKEIVRDWNLDADLVTLSGCQTGLGREVLGEGYIGLANAFLQAGARSLLVSLWRVEDEATSLLMARFYENLTGAYTDKRMGRRAEPRPKAAALREAKQWLRTYTDAGGRQIFGHPVYWSGFVLVGNPQ